MNRNTFAAFFLGSITAVLANGAFSVLTRETPRGSTLRLVNTELIFNPNHHDGGIRTEFRACGYEESVLADGGLKRLGEPCWKGQVDFAVTAPLIDDLLKQGAPLLVP